MYENRRAIISRKNYIGENIYVSFSEVPSMRWRDKKFANKFK